MSDAKKNADFSALAESPHARVAGSEHAAVEPHRALMSVEAVAALLDISVTHIRREIRLKRLACHRLGRLIRISEADLMLYLAARRKGAR